MKKLFQLMLVCGGLAIMNSCNNKDGCEELTCLYDGLCVEGGCVCQDGLTGPNCEIESFDNGVFVLHEGNFQGGNATVSFFLKDHLTMANGVFSTVNGVPLGDVGQSIEIIGNKAFIVVNNSGKIEVVSLDDFRSAGKIEGLSSPRYIAVLSANKAYVSDLFSGVISAFNPADLSLLGTISVNGQVEQMVVVGNRLIAAGTGANYVYSIDSNSDALIDSVNVGVGPSNLVVDSNGKVWVLTNGGYGTEVPKLVRIDPTTLNVELTLDFPSTDNYPGNLEVSGDGNTLYYVDGQVYQMDITSNSLPTAPFALAFAYKCGIDPVDDVVYVSDAGDFNSNGKVYRYQSNGTPIDTFSVRVIPAEYAFTE